MNAEFFTLAFLAAVNPKLLAVDLVPIENRRPQAMSGCLLLGGLTVAVTIGLLDVLVFQLDAIDSQKTVSAGVDLALGLLLLAVGALVATGGLHGSQRQRSRQAAGSRTGRRRRGKRKRAGRIGYWPNPGSGWPSWSASCVATRLLQVTGKLDRVPLWADRAAAARGEGAADLPTARAAGGSLAAIGEALEHLAAAASAPSEDVSHHCGAGQHANR
jgi:hypothetical protein